MYLNACILKALCIPSSITMALEVRLVLNSVMLFILTIDDGHLLQYYEC